MTDANTLHKPFYNELLYILGLRETKYKGSLLIVRELEEKRNLASFFEMIFDALPSNLNESESFDISIELCITWINRILFLKILEAKLLAYNRQNPDYAFLNIEKIKDFEELHELFFCVCTIPIEERNAQAKTKFANIPYLNSSLFDETKLEVNLLTIKRLNNNLKIKIYEKTVLRKGKMQFIGEENTLDYLFQFLNSYDFSGDSQEIQSDKKTIINSAVLGLIFEKINGYKDGSFFTPSYITMYMCRETIRKLLKSMYYRASEKNKYVAGELETLPNIDINIKWGNSLISRFGLGNTQNLLPKDRILVKKLIDDYKTEVFTYKSVKDWKAKYEIRQQIGRIKSELEKFVVPNDKDFAEMRKKEAELGQIAFVFDAKERERQITLTEEVKSLRKKYAEKLQTLYRNTLEWRFDSPEVLDEEGNFVGFDVVVANPPYGVNLPKNHIEVFENNYETFYGRGESYILFIEMANKILKSNGLLAFIIPGTLLNLSFTELSRKYILKNTYLSEIDLLPSTVFSEAVVDTILLFFEKTQEAENFNESDVLVKIYAKKEKLANMDFPQHSFSISTAIWHQQGAFNLQILEKDYEILHKIEENFPVLDSFAKMFSGIKTYEVGKGNPPQTVEIQASKPYTSSEEINEYWSPFLDGKHIGRYEMLWKENNWILYGEHLAAPRHSRNFEGERILIRKIIGDRLISHYVSGNYFSNTLLFILKLLPQKANISYLSLLGILNSRLIAWYFRKKFQISAEDTFPQIMIKDILQFPIPNVENEFTKEIEYLVKHILHSKEETPNANISSFEAKIDEIVYQLYELSPAEIQMIAANY